MSDAQDPKINSGMLPPMNDGQRPLFVSPEAAAAAPYVGAQDVFEQKPVFDEELTEGDSALESALTELAEREIPKEKPITEREMYKLPEALAELPRGVRIRWMEIARLHALGHSVRYIAKRLGYGDSRVSVILKIPAIRDEAFRYRSQLFEQDIVTALKDMGPDATRVLVEMINSPAEKLKDRTEAAKWVLEKLTGKAKQEVNVESNTLSMFMETLRQMQRTGEALAAPQDKSGQIPGQTIDVTPTNPELAPAQQSKWAGWTKQNN